MEQLVKIELLGQSYTFKADTDISKTKEVADLLAKEVDKVELQLSNKITKAGDFGFSRAEYRGRKS